MTSTLHPPRVPAPPYVIERPTGHERPSPDDEWVLSLGNGGFAMGTASGVARRKYHALLIASANPPVERLSCLAGLDEVLILGEGPQARCVHLSSHRLIGGALQPDGVSRLLRFEAEPGAVRWIYQADGVRVTKELRLGWRRNACALRYQVEAISAGGQSVLRARLRLSPRVTLRDFHATCPVPDLSRWRVEALGDALRVHAEGRSMTLRCPGALAVEHPSVLPGVHLDMESERHQEDVDHVLRPGWFEIDLWEAHSAGAQGPSAQVRVAAALDPEPADTSIFDDPGRSEHLERLARSFTEGRPHRQALVPLVLAADAYLVPRRVDGLALMTVLAGFPWFADWGRDTMISLPGLMLACGRTDDARGCLETFARYVSQGMIPNLFDDYGGPPQYNTVDASLWFLHACSAWLSAAEDGAAFDAAMLPACLQIIEHYQRGTRFNIAMDPHDALIIAGDSTTQLTWMDAKRDGVVFTPRHGKAVEINALWHHGLLCVARALDASDPAKSRQLTDLARRVARSFVAAFWDPQNNRLHDCLRLDKRSGVWSPVTEVRPNQIFAVSLEHSPLSLEQQRAVVADVRRLLLTPMGLRTLSPSDPGYRGRFEGDMMARDGAYHNGTVWPWLIGPYCEAVLRAGEFGDEARREVLAAVQPLVESLSSGCLGQIAEVYDGDKPRRAQGCVAQAWSVGETLRAALMALEG